jgi:hypothetical protein
MRGVVQQSLKREAPQLHHDAGIPWIGNRMGLA